MVMVEPNQMKSILWSGNTGTVDASDLGFRPGRGPRALVVQGREKRVTFYFQRTVFNDAKDEALFDLYRDITGVYELRVYND
jgi:hypothetical protein